MYESLHTTVCVCYIYFSHTHTLLQGVIDHLFHVSFKEERKSFPTNSHMNSLIIAPGKLGIMTPFDNRAQSHHVIMRLTEKERQCMVVTTCIEGHLFSFCSCF